MVSKSVFIDTLLLAVGNPHGEMGHPQAVLRPQLRRRRVVDEGQRVPRRVAAEGAEGHLGEHGFLKKVYVVSKSVLLTLYREYKTLSDTT